MWITAKYMVKLDLCNMRSRNLEFEGVPKSSKIMASKSGCMTTVVLFFIPVSPLIPVYIQDKRCGIKLLAC
jgi:hypothetical protein